MCALNANLSDIILYLVTFTFKLAKHKMDTKMLRKPHIFYGLSHIKGQFMVSAIFLFHNFYFIILERNDLYLTFKSKTSAVFDVFTATVSILLNLLRII